MTESINSAVPLANTVAVLALSACGPADVVTVFDDLEVIRPSVEQVSGAPPPMGEFPEPTVLPIRGYIMAMHTILDATVVGTTAGPYRVRGETVEALELWNDGTSDVSNTGAVRSLAPLAGDLLLAGDNGMFVVSGDELFVPTKADSLDGLDVQSMASTEVDGQQHVWLGTASGIFHLQPQDGALEKWRVAEHDTAPQALWADRETMVAAFEDTLYRVDIAARTAVLEDLDFGMIHRISDDGRANLYLATSRGLFRRDPDGAYTQYTLTDDAGPVVVDDLAFDPVLGTIAVTDIGVVRAAPDDSPVLMFELPQVQTPRRVASDETGVVWVGHEETVSGYLVGESISFEEDIVPIFDTYCMGCHTVDNTQGVPAIAFTDYDVAIQQEGRVKARIVAGDMPPRDAEPLPVDAQELLTRWYSIQGM